MGRIKMFGGVNFKKECQIVAQYACYWDQEKLGKCVS